MMVLHGCGSSGDGILMGSKFAHMAASNNIVMIAPSASIIPNYEERCWDGTGYTGPNFAFRYGLQPKTFMNMIHHVLSPGTLDGFL